MDIPSILELNENAKNEALHYPKKRELFHAILSSTGKHFIGIVGPRGVGKTVLLKHIAYEKSGSCYLSLDTLDPDIDLFDLTKILLEKYKIKVLLFDEIHFVNGYEQYLKKIYDFLDVRIIFTSSVSISLYASSYDLSRRVNLLRLYPFSFKEYLFFKENLTVSQLALDDIINGHWETDHLRYEFLFEDYLKMGLYPFTLEEAEPAPLFKNILQKIIHRDIPSVVPTIRVQELVSIEKLVQFIGRSPVDGINYTSLSRNLGITKYKAEEYVALLEKAFILKPVLPKGTNVLKEPKILMYLPFRLLYKPYEECIGALREDFFAEMMQMKGMKYAYLKTRRGKKTPDFLVSYDDKEIIVEVGGRGKGVSQFKGVEAKEKLILAQGSSFADNQRPLSLLGFI